MPTRRRRTSRSDGPIRFRFRGRSTSVNGRTLGVRDQIIEHVYLHLADPRPVDDRGNPIFGNDISNWLADLDPIDTLTYSELLALASQDAGNYQFPRSGQRIQVHEFYLAAHPEIYGSLGGYYGTFSTDQFWNTRTASHPSEWDPWSRFRLDSLHETVVVPEMEAFDRDGESETDERNYITFELTEDETYELREAYEHYLQQPPPDHPFGPHYRRPTIRNNAYSGSAYHPEETDFYNTIPYVPTRTPNSEDGDAGNEPHWRVEGFEGDYVEEWSSDEMPEVEYINTGSETPLGSPIPSEIPSGTSSTAVADGPRQDATHITLDGPTAQDTASLPPDTTTELDISNNTTDRRLVGLESAGPTDAVNGETGDEDQRSHLSQTAGNENDRGIDGTDSN
ncbi:hypothetical protein TWF730_000372 [Orbilia blumenaviensis]|uniref:Uncharacterized protein n=1 Tax=Orbilia blumenaviensis TaxID=1796055 RepID=A0AAV9VP41_9PEZI